MFFKPINFAAMYKAHKIATDFKGKSKEEWDAKSSDMARSATKSPYVDAFISRMDLSPDDTILDIGCGPGTLAVPLAKKVGRVIAVDYSPQMLAQLRAYAEREGVTNIEPRCLSWDDDWNSLPAADVAVASRSLEVGDIEAALEKMSCAARRACYLTYKVGGSYVDMEILDFIGKTIVPKPDFWYIPLILYQKGYLPHVDYIASERGSIKSANADAFVASLRWSLGSLDDTQEQRARHYYEKIIIKQSRHPRPFDWAFIGWKTCA